MLFREFNIGNGAEMLWIHKAVSDFFLWNWNCTRIVKLCRDLSGRIG